MNFLRHQLRTPDQRAATEIKTTLDGLAAGVRELGHSLHALRAQSEKPKRSSAPEPVPAAKENHAAAVILELSEPAPPVMARRPAGVDPSGGAVRSPIIKDEASEPVINTQVGTVPASSTGHEPSAPSRLRQSMANEGRIVTPASNGKSAAEAAQAVAQPQRESVTPQPDAAAQRPYQRTEAPVHPSSAAGPAVADGSPVALPSIPDLRPQLQAFVQTVVRNQEQTLNLLQDAQRLFAAHAAELAELKQQQARQLTWLANSRRL